MVSENISNDEEFTAYSAAGVVAAIEDSRERMLLGEADSVVINLSELQPMDAEDIAWSQLAAQSWDDE